ncbi:MAG TPA: hypothetical protein VFM71_09465 [Gemmatimonadaceae bacterium]|nr:hypothetical protein [Gemmatimonadaceae bacterium]
MRRLALLAAAVLGGTLGAQERPSVQVQLPIASQLTREGPVVRSHHMLSDEETRELLRSGFPARLHYRVELWADGRFFDELRRDAEWDVVVRWEGVDQTYEVIQVVGDRRLSLGAFTRIEDAEAAVSRPVRVPISAPNEDRRFYYRVTLDVEALSVSDLDEVERWLKGELQPAVSGRGNPGTAFTRGLRALTTRLLGGERREYATRSASFRPRR